MLKMDILKQISELITRGDSTALCIITQASGSTPRRAGTKMLVHPDGSITGTIGGGKLESKVIKEALNSLKTGKPILISYSLSDPDKGDPGVCGGQMEVYVEPILKQETLIVIGAGHVGNALAQLGSWLGFKVVLADDRSGYANKENAPDADSFIEGTFDEIIESLNIHENSNVVLTTRNLDIDVEILPHILSCTPKYIGVIGSRRRWRETQRKLIATGFDQNLIDRVHSPTGLEIKAETPKEIALSILAEIIMLREGGTGEQMKA